MQPTYMLLVGDRLGIAITVVKVASRRANTPATYAGNICWQRANGSLQPKTSEPFSYCMWTGAILVIGLPVGRFPDCAPFFFWQVAAHVDMSGKVGWEGFDSEGRQAGPHSHLSSGLTTSNLCPAKTWGQIRHASPCFHSHTDKSMDVHRSWQHELVDAAMRCYDGPHSC